MINITKKGNNKVELVYNTTDGIISKEISYKSLKITENKQGEFKDLNNENSYILDVNGDNYAFSCLFNDKYEKENYYLNTVLQLDNTLLSKLEFPKLVFYDIETNEYATVKTKDNKISDKAIITSIAWIDENNEEYCLINGVNGSEDEIIDQFVKYLQKHKIMGLVGHNSFGFDNKVMISRMKELEFTFEEISIFYSNCNLDTMRLAKFLQYSSGEFISLNELANLLCLDTSKTDTGIFNPITLYNEALEDDKKLELFREYNIQDVRLTKAVFESMEVVKQLTDLFKQTLCPLNKLQFNQELLNSYTCKEALSRKIVIPYIDNPEISFKNKGGFNYFEDTGKLNVYHNVAVMDIVSYYPHLLMLIGADTTYNYPNIDKKTGKIGKFEKVPNGLLSQLARDLYNSRAEIKAKMKATQDNELKEQLDKQQQTKKIIVNSLYGVLSQKGGYYLLKNELIGATITALGRDLLKHVVKKFNGVFAKTDSVFIVLENKEDFKQLLNELNNYINEFLKSKYNLDNFYKGNQLIRFEIDSVLDYLIVKDKNNYIKIANDTKYKGGSFINSKYSQYDNDIVNYLTTSVVKGKDTDTIIEDSITFTKEKISTESLNYFAEVTKLSYKQKDNKIMVGRAFMDKMGLPYTWNFKYNYCRIANNKDFDYIMFPLGYEPENIIIKPSFVYDCLIKRLEQFKLIKGKEKRNLKERLNIKEAKRVIIDNNQNTLDKTYKHENKQDDTKNDTYNSVEDVLTEIYGDKFLRVNYNKLTPPKVFKSIEDIISYKNDAVEEPKFLTTYSFLDTERKELDKFNNIYIDFDTKSKEKGFEDAFNEAIKTANFLKEQFNIDVILNGSGSKGVHIYVLFNQINVKNPTQVLKGLRDYLINELDLNTLDTNVLSSHKRLERIPTSKHNKTGLYSNFFNLNNTYNEVLENMKHKETKILPYKVNRTVNTENRFKELLLELDKKQESKKEYSKTVNIPLKSLNDSEINSVSYSLTKLMEIADERRNKHNLALSIGGYFSRHITEATAEVIINKVVDKVSYLLNDPELCIKTVLDNYINDTEEKTGIPTIIELLNYNSDSIEHINNISKTIDNNYNNIEDCNNIILTNKFLAHSKKTGFNLLYNHYYKMIYMIITENKEHHIVNIETDNIDNLNINNNTGKLIIEKINKYVNNNNESENIANKLIKNLKEFNNDNDKRLNYIRINPDSFIRSVINNNINRQKEIIKNESIEHLKTCFNNIGHTKKEYTLREVRRELTKYIKNIYNVILRANTHDIYILDTKSNAYQKIDFDDLYMKITQDVQDTGLIHESDLKGALGGIGDRLHPQTNLIKFKNCVYDIQEFKTVNLNKPLFTLTEVPYEYKKTTECKYMQQYLFDAFKCDTSEETVETVNGVLEILGYLFTSGNDRTILLIITGIAGAGKSLFVNLISKIFNNNVSSVGLQRLTGDDSHATSELVGKHLNICADASDKPIYENSTIKQVSGNDAISINPKGRDPYLLSPEEVPKTIIACNISPVFANLENAILDRLIYIHFRHKVRGTEKDDKQFIKKLTKAPEMEWLIYNSIETYKKMVLNGNDFILRKDNEETRRNANKFTEPLNYLLHEVIKDYEEDYNNKDVISIDLNKILIKLAEKEGLQLKLNKNGIIQGRNLTETIRKEFYLDDEYNTELKKINKKPVRYYPHLIPTHLYYELLDK